MPARALASRPKLIILDEPDNRADVFRFRTSVENDVDGDDITPGYYSGSFFLRPHDQLQGHEDYRGMSILTTNLTANTDASPHAKTTVPEFEPSDVLISNYGINPLGGLDNTEDVFLF